MRPPVPFDDHFRRHVTAALDLYLRYCREQYLEPHPVLLALFRWTAATDQPRQDTTTVATAGEGVHGRRMRLLLTLDEVADVCGVSRRTIERRIAAGDLPVVRPAGASPRVLREDLERFLHDNRSDYPKAG